MDGTAIRSEAAIVRFCTYGTLTWSVEGHRGGVGASPRRMMKPFALKHFLDCAVDQCGDAVVSWLASRLMHDGKLVNHLSDVAMELP